MLHYELNTGLCVVFFLIFLVNFDKVGVRNCGRDPHPKSLYCETLGDC